MRSFSREFNRDYDKICQMSLIEFIRDFNEAVEDQEELNKEIERKQKMQRKGR